MVAEMNMYLFARRQEYGFDLGVRLRFMPAIWNSYSKSDTARSPRRMTWPLLMQEIHQKIVEPDDLDVRVGCQYLLRQFNALLEREERPLRAALRDADDDTIEEIRCPAHEILVPRVIGSNVPG